MFFCLFLFRGPSSLHLAMQMLAEGFEDTTDDEDDNSGAQRIDRPAWLSGRALRCGLEGPEFETGS